MWLYRNIMHFIKIKTSKYIGPGEVANEERIDERIKYKNPIKRHNTLIKNHIGGTN